MNDKIKKVIIYIVASLALFCAGVCTEQCRCKISDTNSRELSEELERTKTELESLQSAYNKQLTEFESIRKQADGVKLGIDESLRIAGQADESLRRVRLAIHDAGETAEGIEGTIRKLRTLTEELTITVRELQDQNIRLTEELRRIQSSLIE